MSFVGTFSPFAAGSHQTMALGLDEDESAQLICFEVWTVFIVFDVSTQKHLSSLVKYLRFDDHLMEHFKRNCSQIIAGNFASLTTNLYLFWNNHLTWEWCLIFIKQDIWDATVCYTVSGQFRMLGDLEKGKLFAELYVVTQTLHWLDTQPLH